MSLPGMREADFQDQIVQLAELQGWRVYHTFDSRRSNAGFPDLTMVRGPELLFAELKSDTGNVRPEQQEWLDALGVVSDLFDTLGIDIAQGGVDVYVWRPSNFDEIIARLRRAPTTDRRQTV